MLYVNGLWEVSRPRPLDLIHLILPPIGLLGSTNIGTLGQLLWVPVSVSFFNVSIISKYITKNSQDALNLLSVLDFVLISRTLPLGHLQNFRVLLGASAFGSLEVKRHLTLKFEFYLWFSQNFSQNDYPRRDFGVAQIHWFFPFNVTIFVLFRILGSSGTKNQELTCDR